MIISTAMVDDDYCDDDYHDDDDDQCDIYIYIMMKCVFVCDCLKHHVENV